MSEATSPRAARHRWTGALAAVLLALHFAWAVGSKLHESTTSDELVHLTGGFNDWANHDYRLHPENGILPQRWAALPWWLSGAKFPPLAGNEFWRTSDVWTMGHQFFYETGQDHFPHLMAGRAMIALFSAATGLLVFCWSRRLFGDAGALVSLVFFVFCPTYLSLGAVATSDSCMALFFLAAVGAWWWHLHDGRARVWWLSSAVFGLAFVAKYSAVLLLPMIIAMAIVRAFAPEPLSLAGRSFHTRWGKLGAAALSALGHGAVAALIIWAFYGFRYSAFNPALPPAIQFIRTWEDFESKLGLSGQVLHAARTLRLLPEGYLYGFAYVLETTKVRGAFLNGTYSLTGWPTYFLWTFWLKTTVPLLIASALAICLALKRWETAGLVRARRDLYRLIPLIALFVVYWLFSIISHINIGHRHILPIYPVIYIGVGSLGALWMSRRRWTGVVLVALLGWHVISAVRIAPHFIAYFNELAGGPENGRFFLTDSSIDWGQDLPGLTDWLAQNAGTEPVYLSYFGTGEPAYYGVHPRRLAFMNDFKFASKYVALEPGIYCISATILSQAYGPVRGAWTARNESEYQFLRALEPLFAQYTNEPQKRSELERATPADRWRMGINRFDDLRMARLCYYLRRRKPDAQVGYSILIFRLTAKEISAATAGSLADWSALIQSAGPAPP